MQAVQKQAKMLYVDFDGTLVRSTSLHYLLAIRAYQFRNKPSLSSLIFLLLAWCSVPLIIFLHKVSEPARDRLMNRMYWGLAASDIIQGATVYFQQNKGWIFHDQVIELIRDYQQKSYTIVMVSGSLRELIEPAVSACTLQSIIDDYLTPQLIYGPDQKTRGQLKGRPNIQAEKVERIVAYENLNGIKASERIAVTDSMSDLPMLNFCDHGIVVVPKPKLAKLAKQRKWSMIAAAARESLLKTDFRRI